MTWTTYSVLSDKLDFWARWNTKLSTRLVLFSRGKAQRGHDHTRCFWHESRVKHIIKRQNKEKLRWKETRRRFRPGRSYFPDEKPREKWQNEMQWLHPKKNFQMELSDKLIESSLRYRIFKCSGSKAWTLQSFKRSYISYSVEYHVFDPRQLRCWPRSGIESFVFYITATRASLALRVVLAFYWLFRNDDK